MPLKAPIDPNEDTRDGIVLLLALIALIDLLLAVAVDTILLPYDVYGRTKSPLNEAHLISGDSHSGVTVSADPDLPSELGKLRD